MYGRAGFAIAALVLTVAAGCSAQSPAGSGGRSPGGVPARTLPSGTQPDGTPPSGGSVVRVADPGMWEIPATVVDDPFINQPGNHPSAGGLPQRGCVVPSTAGPHPGEGEISLVLAAPGTSWSDPVNTSVVVEATVDGGNPQEFVLFNGAEPFSYEGFLGRMSSGAHCVRVSVRRDLSHLASTSPLVEVHSIKLSVVPTASRAFLLESHAPVLYGRTISAQGDTPMLTYGTSEPDSDGVDTDLAYTVIWTHEDLGDGSVPPYQWGRWGRMTDIETVLTEKVSPGGRIRSARYLSCGCEGKADFPDSAINDSRAGGETYKQYPSAGATQGSDDHLGIRDATGNNDESPYGTTGFRFQQSLVAAPRPGESREVAMDRNPWTYRISGEEVTREAQSSLDPRSVLAGVYPQYLIADLTVTATGTFSIAVEVRVAGDPTWYSSDYAQASAPGPPTTYPFFNGGHGRTVVKLPSGWNGRAIDGLRVRLNAEPGATPALQGDPSIDLIEVTPSFGIAHPQHPPPVVVIGQKRYPPVTT